MHRRDFVRYTTLGLVSAAGYLNWSCNAETILSIKAQLIKTLDEQIPKLLQSQVKDQTHTFFGGIPDAFQIYHPGSIAGFIQTLTTVYLFPESKYYHDTSLIQAMVDGIDFLTRAQHDDGTIDLLTTNFHSTPDTGFVVEPLAISYKLLKSDQQPSTEKLLNKIQAFLNRAGEALSKGGIHTPNHRWVVCMSLSRLNELFPNEAYVNRIDTWLAEGIDIDTDGQYTERSTAVYSPLTNRCLITIARIMNKPELFEPVRKNLDMTLYYIHPNGELVTEASRRQDQYQGRHAEAYYYPYWFMSITDNNGVYQAMKNFIETDVDIKNLTGILPYLLEDDTLNKTIEARNLPVEFEKFFEASSLIRWRADDVDATILAKNSTLFSFHHDHAVLQAVRISSAFFGKGQFIADQLIKTTSGYQLIQKLEGPYYQPFPKDSLPAVGDWEKIPRERRPKSEVQTIQYTVDLYHEKENWFLDFTIEGTDEVPVAIELSFRPGGKLSGVEEIKGSEDVFILKGEEGKYSIDGASILFGPGKDEHQWIQLRGAEPKLPGISVYLTGYTPFKHRLYIKPGHS